MAHLLTTSGPDKGQAFALDTERVTIGREADNDIALRDTAASRSHAQVVRRSQQYYICDSGSTNGTFVNDRRIRDFYLLRAGDVITIGHTHMVFEGQSPTPTAQPAPRSRAQASEATDDKTTNVPLQQDPRNTTIEFSMPSVPKQLGEGLSAQHLKTLARVSQTVQSTLDLDELLEILMDLVFETLAPDRGVVLLYKSPGANLAPHIVRPPQDSLDSDISYTIIDHVVRDRLSLLVTDAAADERFKRAESVEKEKILSAICCPLIAKNKVLGVIYIDSRRGLMAYTRDDVELMNHIAVQAAISIENARLVAEKVEAERLAAIGTAVAGISHRIKDILNGLEGSSALIESGIDSDDLKLIASAWPLLKSSTQKVSSFLNAMLAYTRKQEPVWEEGNLNMLLQEVCDQSVELADSLGIVLTTELGEDLPNSQYAPRDLGRALQNIVGNAIEACAERDVSAIVIKSDYQQANNKITISIIDNGPGIRDDLRERVFEPFFSTKDGPGVGLGLALARKAIEEHGGRIALDSIVGVGTSVYVRLPRNQGP